MVGYVCNGGKRFRSGGNIFYRIPQRIRLRLKIHEYIFYMLQNRADCVKLNPNGFLTLRI